MPVAHLFGLGCFFLALVQASGVRRRARGVRREACDPRPWRAWKRVRLLCFIQPPGFSARRPPKQPQIEFAEKATYM